jgi:hypothetical protein
MYRRPRTLKTILAGLVCVLAVGSADARAMDQAKREDIKTLLQITGALTNAQMRLDATLPQILGLIRKANPNIPQPVIDELIRDGLEESRKAIPELEEPLIAIYDANFTGDEIKAILAFDRSPLGQKVIKQQPQMMRQSMAVGQVWGKSVGQRVAARMRDNLQKRGYKL